MAEVRVYRTYRYVDKNPVIDKARTILQDEGLFKKLTIVHEISGVATATMHNWFHGDTRNPQHGTIMAVLSALGYEETFVKKKEIDVEKERKLAADWLERHPRPKRKMNGSKKK
jgi:hypothetical protein